MTQDVNVIKGNVGRIYVLKGGEIKDPLRMSDFHPLSNTSGLLVHIEDGGGQRSIGKINFAPQLRGDNDVAYHWFPMYFRGFVEATVSSESAPRTFAQYFVHVPSQILALNENKKKPMDVALTMVTQGGVNYLGQFSTLLELNTEHAPTEDLSNDMVIGFVWEVSKRGFYQVEWDALNSQYIWKKISDGQAYVRLQQKQYNLSYMTVQGGYAPQVERQALKDPQFEALMLEINDINSRLYQYSVDFNDLEIRVADNEAKTDNNESRIDDLEYDTERLQDEKVNKAGDTMAGNLDLDNYKIKNVKLESAELFDDLDAKGNKLKNAKIDDGVADDDPINKGQFDDGLALKVDKTTTVATLPLSANIGMNELVNELRVATDQAKGLMSKEDKDKLDQLYALLTDDPDNVINTLSEVFAILEDYPEGFNLAQILDDLRDNKVEANAPITANENPVVSYDEKGLVTSGRALIESDIPKLGISKITALETELEARIDKNFSSYPELEEIEISDDDEVIVRDISTNTTKKTTVSRLRQFESNVIEYGVRFNINQNSSTGIRLKRVNGELFVGGATNMVANVGVDDAVVENSFDNVDIFNTVKQVINGNIMVGRKAYYHKTEFVNIDDQVYVDEWITEKPKAGMAGYYRAPIFIDKNNNDIPLAYLSAHEASTVDNVARSIPNVFPSHSLLRNTARERARRNDGDGSNVDSLWGIKDRAEYFYHIELPFWIEFATRNSQSVLVGVTGLPYSDSHVSLYAESDTNQIVIANSYASQFVVGQTISIGTARGSYSVARERIVLSVTLDSPEDGEGTITFDGAPVTTLVGSVVYSMGWKAGMTDNVRASSGAFTANSDKYPIVFRGYENPWGNIYKFVDGIKISNNWAWICLDKEAYDDVVSVEGNYGANWLKLSYQNALVDGYIKALGYDQRFPFARFPVEVGGDASNNNYYADHYYQNTGDRTVRVGGGWNAGSSAGLSLWALDAARGSTSLNIGFRLSYRPLLGG